MIAFLDTEFTNLVKPELPSLGLAALDGREFYVELDLSTPGATCTDQAMGRRTAEWLLDLAARCGTRIEVAFDYVVDFELRIDSSELLPELNCCLT
jgi:hypothetical protein